MVVLLSSSLYSTVAAAVFKWKIQRKQEKKWDIQQRREEGKKKGCEDRIKGSEGERRKGWKGTSKLYLEYII